MQSGKKKIKGTQTGKQEVKLFAGDMLLHTENPEASTIIKTKNIMTKNSDITSLKGDT